MCFLTFWKPSYRLHSNKDTPRRGVFIWVKSTNTIMIAYLLALSALISSFQPTTVAGIAGRIPEFFEEPHKVETTVQEIQNVVEGVKTAWVTAYSSTPEETDDTPFVTASGTSVRDGVIATNFLEFGTKNMPAHPFIRPAFDAMKATSIRIIAEEISAGVNRLGDSAGRLHALSASGELLSSADDSDYGE